MQWFKCKLGDYNAISNAVVEMKTQYEASGYKKLGDSNAISNTVVEIQT